MKPTPQEVRLTMIGVFLGVFLAALDQTIVATAMPRIVSELKGAEYYAWVTTSYLLASTVAAPIFGRLTELFSRKAILVWAIGIFLLGSALSGLAQNMPQLVLFRGFQGVGGVALFALALATIALFFPPRERGRIGGLFGALFGLSSAVGPWLGGALTDWFSWRAVFYINLPIGGLGLLFIARYMPRLRPLNREGFDFLGAFLLALWTVPLLLALSWGGHTYPWDSPRILGLLALALLGLLLWVGVELKVVHPLFDLSLLRRPSFTLASLAAFFLGPAFLASVIFIPLYLQVVKGVSPSQSGLAVLPLTLGVVMGSLGGGQLLARLGRYKPLLLGTAVYLLAFLLFLRAVLQVETPLWEAVLFFFLLGLGLGPFQSVLNIVAQSELPLERLGSGTSMVQFLRQIGSTLGLALLGSLLAASLSQELGRVLPVQASGALAQEGMSLDLEREWARWEGLVLKALDGDLAAQKALASTPLAQALPPLADLEARVQKALSGDKGAQEALLKTPWLPGALKSLLQGNNLSGFREAWSVYKAQVKAGALDRLEEERARVEGALKEGVVLALHRVFGWAVWFVALGLLALLPLPNRVLQGRMGSGGVA